MDAIVHGSLRTPASLHRYVGRRGSAHRPEPVLSSAIPRPATAAFRRLGGSLRTSTADVCRADQTGHNCDQNHPGQGIRLSESFVHHSSHSRDRRAQGDNHHNPLKFVHPIRRASLHPRLVVRQSSRDTEGKRFLELYRHHHGKHRKQHHLRVRPLGREPQRFRHRFHFAYLATPKRRRWQQSQLPPNSSTTNSLHHLRLGFHSNPSHETKRNAVTTCTTTRSTTKNANQR